MYIKKKKLISVVALGILLLVSAVAPAYTESYGGAKPAYAQLSPTEQAQEQGSGMTPQGFDQSSKDATADVEQRGLVPCTLTECTFCHLLRLMERIFFWLLSLAFAVAVFFVVVSGFLYIFSIGDSSMMSFAKEGLKLSLIGFVICILSWLSIHLVYTVLGYKGGNWWQIDCSSEQIASITPPTQTANPYKNEVASNSLGGRSNPIALPDLASQGIAAIPENKYFFIHGIGGQPLKNSAQQIAKITQEAKEQKKIVYAAVPYQDLAGNIVGSRLINLNNFLPGGLSDDAAATNLPQEMRSQLANIGSYTEKKTDSRFFDLLASLLLKSISQEIPIIVSGESTQLPDFSGIWPEANWTGMEGDGTPPAFKAFSSVVSGLHYQEGNGPFFYDPERYDGEIPENQTHVQINLTKEGALDTKNPISVLNVAPGVSEEELDAYLRQFIDVIFELRKQADAGGEKDDFITNMIDILTRATNEKLNRIANKNKKAGVLSSENYNKNGNDNYKSKNSNSNLDMEAIDSILDKYLGDNYTGGSGILPDKIQKNNNNQSLSKKQANDLIKQIMQDRSQNGSNSSGRGRSSGSGNTGGSSSSSGSGNTGTSGTSSPGTGDTAGTGNNTGTGNDWSDTSISTRGYTLNEKERARLKTMIAEVLEDLKLPIDPEFVMCMIARESTFNRRALNNNGEYSVGLMQLNKRRPGGRGTPWEAANALEKYGRKTYEKLLSIHGNKEQFISDASLMGDKDPSNDLGITNIALGCAYLKQNNVRYGRGDGLDTIGKLGDLARSYNAGPGRGKSENAYSRGVMGCFKGKGGKVPYNN